MECLKGWSNHGRPNHCFCVTAAIQHAMVDHRDVTCCWCGQGRCESYTPERVEGHGPHRTKLVLQEEEVPA